MIIFAKALQTDASRIFRRSRRNPCWHIKRDMCILLDGTVPACKEDLYAERSYGNALTDKLPGYLGKDRSRIHTTHKMQLRRDVRSLR